MSKQGLPAAVQHLIRSHLRSLDHVVVLLAVRVAGETDAVSLSAHTGLTLELVAQILEELEQRGLLARHATPHGLRYRFESEDAITASVAQLADMYNTKPVTLVRAIYDRNRTEHGVAAP